MKIVYLIVALVALLSFQLFSQVSVNADGAAPDSSAMLDVKSSNKGVLIPRVALMGSNVAGPVDSPSIGLLVYNTVNAGIAPNKVAPDFYYWNGARWTSVVGIQGSNPGDMLYWNGSQWIMVPVGLPGQYLQLSSSNIPQWSGISFPSVTTDTASSVTNCTAVSGGEVTMDNGQVVTSRGICYGISPNPTILNNKIPCGSGLGTFTANITGLSSATTYYVRAYATNSGGTAYGNEISFITGTVVPPPMVPGREHLPVT